MTKKLFSVILLTMLLASTLTMALGSGQLEATGLSPRADEVSLPVDAVLSVKDTIGDRHAEYWEHVIDDVIYVKNDYVLIHVDADTSETVTYDKKWRDIELPSVEIKPFEPPGGEHFWKKVVVFLNEEDCGHFYTFDEVDDIHEYPLVCWEVRYVDGTTIMYGLDGGEIGNGIPAPSRGSSFSGMHNGTDAWVRFRTNAHGYFQQWCDSTATKFNATGAQISSNVSNSDTRFYYAIAHGDSRSFFGNDTDGSLTTYYQATSGWDDPNVRTDMQNRDPMLFAFMGHCEGMTDIDVGTFSYEFRKGQMQGSVTVGYTGMASSPGWVHARDWQNHMFLRMNEGLTIWDAFNSACQAYPSISSSVRFVGDTNVRVTGVKGLVGNGETGWPLWGAKVAVPQLGLEVFTNCGGYYEIFLPPGNYTLTASYFTFYNRTSTVRVLQGWMTQQHFLLEPMYPGFPIPVGSLESLLGVGALSPR